MIAAVEAQSKEPFQYKNNVQFELGGHGLIYSFNYERIILNYPRFKTTGQTGFSYYPPILGFRDTWIPVGLNEILSFGKHHIDLGLGFVFNWEAGRDSENNPNVWFWSKMASFRIGYRYQKADSRFLLRIAFTPVIEYGINRNLNYEIHPLRGASIGYVF